MKAYVKTDLFFFVFAALLVDLLVLLFGVKEVGFGQGFGFGGALCKERRPKKQKGGGNGKQAIPAEENSERDDRRNAKNRQNTKNRAQNTHKIFTRLWYKSASIVS